MFTFVKLSNSTHRKVALVIAFRLGALRVVNIVPRRGELSTAQYNGILGEFHLRFLHPVASSLGSHVELSRDELSTQDVFGWKAVELLKAFSSLANKSVPHPADCNRWFLFLICLHQRPRHPEESDLLHESLLGDGWSLERANKLVSEYEFARGLLQSYYHENSGAVFAA